MQVFVPHDTYEESVRVLDNRRLGKQRVETYQIINVLLGISPGKHLVRMTKTGKPVYEWDGTFGPKAPGAWRNHPAVLAWRPNLGALMLYQEATVAEWTARGHADTCLEKTEAALNYGIEPGCLNYDRPWWWGREDVHSSHRSRLLAKDPEWYSQFGWTDPVGLEYVWPHELEKSA